MLSKLALALAIGIGKSHNSQKCVDLRGTTLKFGLTCFSDAPTFPQCRVLCLREAIFVHQYFPATIATDWHR